MLTYGRSDDLKKNFKFAIILIMSILVLMLFLGMMYYFSSQEGSISSQQSNKVLVLVDKIRDKVTLQDENIISIKEKVFNALKSYGNKSYVIRKLAHFSIYACIGIAMAFVIYLISKKIFMSAFFAYTIATLYAYFDEYRQLSVAGRSGNLQDVLIDSTGAFFGVWIFIFVVGGVSYVTRIFKKVLKRG